MNKLIYLLVAAASLSLGAATPATGVTGTDHDLTASGSAVVSATLGTTSADQMSGLTSSAAKVADTEICVYCHSPHNNAANPLSVPLWNHQTSTATYTMYTSVSMQATPGSNATMGMSLACMSCHDGTVGVASTITMPYQYGSFYNASSHFVSSTTGLMSGATTSSTGVVTAAPGYTLTTNLTGDHPIGIVYDYTNTAAGLKDPGSFTAALPLYTAAGAKLYGGSSSAGVLGGTLAGTGANKGYVQCGSCHDVHNWQGATSSSEGWFLRAPIAGSAICLNCHAK